LANPDDSAGASIAPVDAEGRPPGGEGSGHLLAGDASQLAQRSRGCAAWPCQVRLTTRASSLVLASASALASAARVASIVWSDCLIVDRMLELASRMGSIVPRLKSSIRLHARIWTRTSMAPPVRRSAGAALSALSTSSAIAAAGDVEYRQSARCSIANDRAVPAAKRRNGLLLEAPMMALTVRRGAHLRY
jgi:hypothetical protein